MSDAAAPLRWASCKAGAAHMQEPHKCRCMTQALRGCGDVGLSLIKVASGTAMSDIWAEA